MIPTKTLNLKNGKLVSSYGNYAVNEANLQELRHSHLSFVYLFVTVLKFS
jgi:hypothetical protein